MSDMLGVALEDPVENKGIGSDKGEEDERKEKGFHDDSWNCSSVGNEMMPCDKIWNW